MSRHVFRSISQSINTFRSPILPDQITCNTASVLTTYLPFETDPSIRPERVWRRFIGNFGSGRKMPGNKSVQTTVTPDHTVYLLSNTTNLLHHLKKECLNVTFKQIEFSDDLKVSPANLSDLRENGEVIIADPNILGTLLYKLPKLKWVQTTWAGMDAAMKHLDATQPLPNFKLTRFGGVFGLQMAEYVISQIVCRERSFFKIVENQRNSKWDQASYKAYRPLSVLTITILGFGDIGKDVGRLCKEFGMTVFAVTRSAEKGNEEDFVDKYWRLADMQTAFSESDYICCVLPKTTQTDGILNGDLLKCCREKKTVLINVGRGNIISDDQLRKALSDGWIGGAILDVFNTEPLPADHFLWAFENVSITPHLATISHAPQVVQVFRKNLEKYLKNEKLEFLVNWNKLY